MKTVHMSSKDFEDLKPISMEHYTVFKVNLNNLPYIVKRLKINKKNTMYIVDQLDKEREIMPSECCLPEFYIKTDNNDFLAFPFIDGISSGQILASESISHQEKIMYLKKIGGLLRKFDQLRKKYFSMRRFAIGDVHEENILVTPDKDIHIIDLDTCKIGRASTCPAKYLTYFSLAAKISKYKMAKCACIETNKETDLYCYMIMILNYIFNSDVARLSVAEYKNYINHLDMMGLNKELIHAFYQIISKGPNINPDYLLDSLDERFVQKNI